METNEPYYRSQITPRLAFQPYILSPYPFLLPDKMDAQDEKDRNGLHSVEGNPQLFALAKRLNPTSPSNALVHQLVN